MATGLTAGMHAAERALGRAPRALPRATAMGSLCHYIANADPKRYQPANIAFDILPVLDEEAKAKFKRDKKARHAEVCRRAAAALDEYLEAR